MLLPGLDAANAAIVGFPLLELPELGSNSTLVLGSAISETLPADAPETAAGWSTEAPNLKAGAAGVEGFTANPKLLPLEVAEVLVLVSVWTNFAVLVKEGNTRASPVDACFVSLEEAAVNNIGGLETSGPSDTAEGTVSDFPFTPPAFRGFR